MDRIKALEKELATARERIARLEAEPSYTQAFRDGERSAAVKYGADLERLKRETLEQAAELEWYRQEFAEIQRAVAESCESQWERAPMPHLSRKGMQWMRFSWEVLQHIRNYVVPQYGDLPDAMIDGFSIQGLKDQFVRYVGRIGTNARGPEEARRDCLKIAHYSLFLWEKLREESSRQDACITNKPGKEEVGYEDR